MNTRLMMMLPGLQPDELMFLEQLIGNLSEEQTNLFIGMYASRRKSSETILICTIIGFFGVSGVQRFILGQIGMGLLYLFTGGLCVIGTIVDLVNHKKMTRDYNQRQAFETLAMITR